MSEKKYLIAIDGGGTKTEAVLFSPGGDVLKRTLSKGANPNIYGTEACISTLNESIKSTADNKYKISGIYIGCAGFATGSNALTVKQALEKLYPEILIGCAPDIITAARSVSEEEKLICCIAGTGSAVTAVCGENYRVFGGLGVMFNEKGSGFSIGRDAVIHAVETRDFEKTPDSLTLAVEKKTGGCLRDKISLLYASGASFTASFSETVFKEAENSNIKAEKIINENALYLAELINKVNSSYPDCKTAVLTGSLFKNERYLNTVLSAINKNITAVCKGTPQVLGAAVLACKMCSVRSDSFADNFMKNYALLLKAER